MLYVFKHLAGILLEWARALRGWRENPLCRYWMLAERRRSAARPWWLRSPGLALFGVIIALAVTAGELLVMLDFNRLSQTITIASRLHVIHHVSLASSILIGGILIFTLVWLLTRVHAAVMLSLGFLETDPRQVLRTILDDLVATSQLSAQDILIGAVTYCLRLVIPPLAVLSLAGFLAALPRLQWQLTGLQTWIAGDPAAFAQVVPILQSIAGMVMMFIGGCLAIVILCCLCISISLNRQSAMAPSIGAVSLVVMQVLLLCGAVYIRGAHLSDYGMGHEIGGGSLMIFILLICLLLYLARRLLWLRRILAYGFPLLILVPAELFLGVIVFEGFEAKAFGVVFAAFIWAMQSLAVIAPLSLLEVIGGDYRISFCGVWYQAVLVLGQLALVIAMAEFARDAIRRRKWGAESERV